GAVSLGTPCVPRALASPCDGGPASVTGGGRNATGLARHRRRSLRSPTCEPSPMAFLGGGVCRERGPSPPPDASSGLDRLPSSWHRARWPIQAADASPSPLFATKAMPSPQGEATFGSPVGTREGRPCELLAWMSVYRGLMPPGANRPELASTL